MPTTNIDEYLEIIESFDNAMLVTRSGSQLRSRPMAIANVRKEDGSVWFLTSIDTGKLEEITEHPEANLALQKGMRFLSITGTTVTTRDRAKRDELWSPAFSVWFPEGKDDPSLLVLGVIPVVAEYWDHSSVKGAKILFELGKTALTGDAPEFDEKVHQKIDFS